MSEIVQKITGKIKSSIKNMFKAMFRPFVNLAKNIITKILLKLTGLLMWAVGDSTEPGLKNCIRAFKPAVIMVITGLVCQFAWEILISAKASAFAFILAQLIILIFAIRSYFKNPIKSHFIPQLYYNIRVLWLIAIVLYGTYVFYLSEETDMDMIVTFIAICIVGLFPYILWQILLFGWQRYYEKLTPEEQAALAISSPADLIRAQKAIQAAQQQPATAETVETTEATEAQ